MQRNLELCAWVRALAPRSRSRIYRKVTNSYFIKYHNLLVHCVIQITPSVLILLNTYFESPVISLVLCLIHAKTSNIVMSEALCLPQSTVIHWNKSYKNAQKRYILHGVIYIARHTYKSIKIHVRVQELTIGFTSKSMLSSVIASSLNLSS